MVTKLDHVQIAQKEHDEVARAKKVIVSAITGNPVEYGLGPITPETQRITIATDQPNISINLPTDAATATNQVTINNSIGAIDSKILGLTGKKVSAASLSVTIASDEIININNISGTISLPTGAATSALQTTINNNIALFRDDFNVKTPTLGQKFKVGSVPVVLALDSDSLQVSQNGAWVVDDVNIIRSNTNRLQPVHTLRRNYGTDPITTAADFTILANLNTISPPPREIEIFDSSGEIIMLKVAGNNTMQIFPGGNGRVPFDIGVGALAVRAVSANANVGDLVINFYG